MYLGNKYATFCCSIPSVSFIYFSLRLAVLKYIILLLNDRIAVKSILVVWAKTVFRNSADVDEQIKMANAKNIRVGSFFSFHWWKFVYTESDLYKKKKPFLIFTDLSKVKELKDNSEILGFTTHCCSSCLECVY